MNGNGLVSCAAFILVGSSAAAVGLIAGALALGVSAVAIDQVMTWGAIPWFLFWWWLCKTMHETPIVFVDGDDKRT